MQNWEQLRRQKIEERKIGFEILALENPLVRKNIDKYFENLRKANLLRFQIGRKPNIIHYIDLKATTKLQVGSTNDSDFEERRELHSGMMDQLTFALTDHPESEKLSQYLDLYLDLVSCMFDLGDYAKIVKIIQNIDINKIYKNKDSTEMSVEDKKVVLKSLNLVLIKSFYKLDDYDESLRALNTLSENIPKHKYENASTSILKLFTAILFGKKQYGGALEILKLLSERSIEKRRKKIYKETGTADLIENFMINYYERKNLTIMQVYLLIRNRDDEKNILRFYNLSEEIPWMVTYLKTQFSEDGIEDDGKIEDQLALKIAWNALKIDLTQEAQKLYKGIDPESFKDEEDVKYKIELGLACCLLKQNEVIIGLNLIEKSIKYAPKPPRNFSLAQECNYYIQKQKLLELTAEVRIDITNFIAVKILIEFLLETELDVAAQEIRGYMS